MMILPALVPGVISAIALPDLRPFARHRTRHGRHRLGARRAQRALRDAGGDGAALHAAEKPDRGGPRSRRRPGRRLPADHAALSDAGDPWRVDLLLLLSFDDFVRSFFLGGYQPTLPVLIFADAALGHVAGDQRDRHGGAGAHGGRRRLGRTLCAPLQSGRILTHDERPSRPDRRRVQAIRRDDRAA
jgi:hypothetical protein